MLLFLREKVLELQLEALKCVTISSFVVGVCWILSVLELEAPKHPSTFLFFSINTMAKKGTDSWNSIEEIDHYYLILLKKQGFKIFICGFSFMLNPDEID